jgi:hypothetical protein
MNQALNFPINGRDEAANWQPKRYRYWYDNIIDILLAEPHLSQKEIALKLGRHAATIGMIMNSDLFRARYEQRRSAKSLALQETLNGKLTATATLALEITEEVLRKKRDQVPLGELVDVADKALARLGYGPKVQSSSAQVVVNNATVVAPVSADELRSARAKLIDMQANPGGKVEPGKDDSV